MKKDKYQQPWCKIVMMPPSNSLMLEMSLHDEEGPIQGAPPLWGIHDNDISADSPEFEEAGPY